MCLCVCEYPCFSVRSYVWECLRVVFVFVSVFVREFVYVCVCVCVSLCDVLEYVCLRMYVRE